jgi:hypothetical protein
VLFRSRDRLKEFRIKFNKTKENRHLKSTPRYKERTPVGSKPKAIAGDSLD